MSVRLNGSIILLEGQCRVEDAEPLLGWLQADRSRVVDLTGTEHVHAAVFQVLMALRPSIKEGGKDAFIREWLIPILTAPAPSGATQPEG
jgi:anti-anti-sigma regulatory factor